MTTSHPPEVFTIGYQGRNLEEFIHCLVACRIDTLVDVRHTPWSRKRGFTGWQLAEALRNNGIEYVHVKQFGSAPTLRDELKATGDWEAFAASYAAYLLGLNGVVEAAMAQFRGKRVCLLCFEASHQECHRSILADWFVECGVGSRPTHL